MFEIEQIRWLVKSTVERAVLCGIRNLAFIMETVIVFPARQELNLDVTEGWLRIT